MQKRYISIWFRQLCTDWFIRRQPELAKQAFVLAKADHGRLVITAANKLAQSESIYPGMAVADARAIHSLLIVLNDQPELAKKLLTNIAEWCIRFTPVAAVDEPDGLILDVTGCAHLWKGEKEYLCEIYKRLKAFGYEIRIAIADTIGAAWAIARYGKESVIIEPGEQKNALRYLPVAALRPDAITADRLNKLGLRTVNSFMNIPRPSLRRRFGIQLLHRLDEAFGTKEEWLIPVQPISPYQERLPCMDPILTRTGIEIALERMLSALCGRLQKEQKGLRSCVFKSYRVDGKLETIEIGTNRTSCNPKHLFKLFENKIDSIEPALGIELFMLDALKTEELNTEQETLWDTAGGGLDDIALAELLDRIAIKIGSNNIHRYLPAEHYWPERSFKIVSSTEEKLSVPWKLERPRPLQLLPKPQQIEVTAPIPDYPPMNFRFKGKLHKIIKADGPERIEQEWWLQDGQHRDYYTVEDEEGKRYWLFRSGHYDAEKTFGWFIHGFFA